MKITFYLTMFRQNVKYDVIKTGIRPSFYLTMFRQNNRLILNIQMDQLTFYLTMFRQNDILEWLAFIAAFNFLSHNVQTKHIDMRDYDTLYRTFYLTMFRQNYDENIEIRNAKTKIFLSHNVQTKRILLLSFLVAVIWSFYLTMFRQNIIWD